MLVTDANIWIDLENGGVLEVVFMLSYQWATPDAVVDEELGPLGAGVCARGVTALVADEELQAQWEELRLAHRLPSDADLYGLVHARHLGARLVTGDRDLRHAAESEGVQVSGILWLLDELVTSKLCTGPDAGRALRAMLDANARLPEAECEQRFRRWVRR